MNKILVLIPTYNEADNVGHIYSQIKALSLKTDILFVDDNSPDGTSKIVKNIIKKDTTVKLLLRRKKEGIGAAHLAGINWAYKRRYNTLITMDCDLTHKPKDIVRLIRNSQNYDIVVGSRFINKKSLSEWNFSRKLLTKTGHFLTKLLLNMKYDATGAFRLYRIDRIPEKIFNLTESKGYSFFFESLFIFFVNGIGIKELSIDLPARTYGSSKMKFTDAFNSLKFLFQTYFLSKIYRDSYIYSPQFLHKKSHREKDEREWDQYWLSERKKRKILYDATAVFYRKYIIKNTLNYYVEKFFARKAKVLHAGCGGGQVDSEVVHLVNVTALDISSEALNRYKGLYGNLCKIIHGSILKIPSKNGQFDGIYNLGVMEHFTQKNIKKILDEFNRVLKPNGQILLFWPPHFGLSVIFLNSMHFILNNIFRSNIRLHPHEITKVKSKKQMKEILAKSGFKLKGFYFGPQDLFTYVVIVGEKNI